MYPHRHEVRPHPQQSLRHERQDIGAGEQHHARGGEDGVCLDGWNPVNGASELDQQFNNRTREEKLEEKQRMEQHIAK